MVDELQGVGPRERGTPPANESETVYDGLVSVSDHRPIHFYLGGNCYWLSAATLYHQPFFREAGRKDLFVQEFDSAARAWGVELIACTVMENHYHAIIWLKEASSLTRFVGRIHGRTAKLVNELDRQPRRQVWRQYWDRVLQTEGDFWSRLNYLWWNPVRHEYCTAPEEWQWTQMPEWFVDDQGPMAEARKQFPAPKTLPGDSW